ncbi:hypothetical protein [Thalassobellus sediminis]|uniref:hypothetical protein n=1 Tax=Thalassobellus sediminis TaxID=3367753 RepID=UPI0037AE13B7
MIKNIIIFLFVMGHVFGQDQEARIFFHDGTQIDGFGSIVSNYKIKFRTSLENKADTWTDLMVKGITFYGFQTKVKFEYHYENSKKNWPLLLEVIEEGHVNIYIDSHIATLYVPIPLKTGFDLNSFDFKKKKIYFKRPEETEVIKFNYEFYKNAAEEYFIDCPSLVTKVKNEKFRKSNVIELLYYYNDCDDEMLD